MSDSAREIVALIRHSARAVCADDVSRTQRTLTRMAALVEERFVDREPVGVDDRVEFTDPAA